MDVRKLSETDFIEVPKCCKQSNKWQRHPHSRVTLTRGQYLLGATLGWLAAEQGETPTMGWAEGALFSLMAR